MTLFEVQQEIIEEFALFGDDWEQKYEHLIQMGKDLTPLLEAEKSDEKLIKGCQSKVWLQSEWKDSLVYFRADSDAIIAKGIVALVIRVLNGRTSSEISSSDFEFLNTIGLTSHLSPTRANGLLSMIRQMKLDASVLEAHYSQRK
ncbi:MAG: hypothetical protein RLZZ46_465 [Bacteroidota bacterium]|jgi:cysteine desulfuration protein SufE